jgi:hypothetical protein
VGNPICVWRTDLQDWLESKRAADNLIRKTMEREKNERTQFYSAHGIKETAEIRDRVEDKRARFYGKTANATSIESRTFPYVGASVSPAIKVETPEGQSGVLTGQVFCWCVQSMHERRPMNRMRLDSPIKASKPC